MFGRHTAAEPMILILPQNPITGYYMQEECCWSRNSATLGLLALHAAAHVNAVNPANPVTAIVPWDVSAPPPAEPFGLVFSWPFGDELTPLASTASLLIANPSGCAPRLAALFPRAVVIPARDVFQRSAPLPFHLLPSRVWPSFRAASVWFSTGCPWSCPFCVWAAPYAHRAPQALAADISAVIASTRNIGQTPSSLLLLGNEISGKPTWLNSLAQHLPPGLKFTADINCRNVTLDDLTTAWNIGLRTTCLGIEFLTDSMLQKLGKGHTVSTAFQAMTWLQELGIAYRFSLRSGVGETPADLAELERNLQTMRALDLSPDHIYCGSMREWPGHEWLPTGVETVNIGSTAFPSLTPRLTQPVKDAWKSTFDTIRSFGWPIS